MVTDAELPLAASSLRFLVKLMASQPALGASVAKMVLPQVREEEGAGGGGGAGTHVVGM